ncbi:MAG: cob(I)yrinic acid a,c-diamide adenosyltransferase, partial [Nanoarchaeota archaeon]
KEAMPTLAVPAALGIAARALGHGKKVVIIQFMKGRSDVGEYRFFSKRKGCTIKQFGAKSFVNLKHPSDKDRWLALEGMVVAKELLKRKPFLMILDEINLAASIGLVDERDVLQMLKSRPKGTSIYLTGRRAPKSFIHASDFATEVKEIKYPRKVYTKEGICF